MSIKDASPVGKSKTLQRPKATKSANDSSLGIDTIPKVRKARTSKSSTTQKLNKEDIKNTKAPKPKIKDTDKIKKSKSTLTKKSSAQASSSRKNSSDAQNETEGHKRKPKKTAPKKTHSKPNPHQVRTSFKASAPKKSVPKSEQQAKQASSPQNAPAKNSVKHGVKLKNSTQSRVEGEKESIQNPYVQSDLSKVDLKNRNQQLYTSMCLWNEEAEIDGILHKGYEQAYKALYESTPEHEIGEYVGIKKPLENDTVQNSRQMAQAEAKNAPYYEVATHLFECTLDSYKGWNWFVTVARSVKGRPTVNDITISEIGLLPGSDALIPSSLRSWDKVHIESDKAVKTFS